MASRRRKLGTAVPDQTSPQLHAPRGGRASPAKAERRYGVFSSREAIIDGKGKTLAADAGAWSGPTRLPRTKRRRSRRDDEGQEEGEARAKKRKRQAQDRLERLDFVERPSILKTARFPPPSSDLLKSVHHFASKFYTERGEMHDVAKEARREKRERKRRRDAYKIGMPSENMGGSADEKMEEKVFEGEEGVIMRKKGWKAQVSEKWGRTMYRSMDGGALVFIGMLLQEHVAALVRTREESENRTEGEQEDEGAEDDLSGGGWQTDVDSVGDDEEGE